MYVCHGCSIPNTITIVLGYLLTVKVFFLEYFLLNAEMITVLKVASARPGLSARAEDRDYRQ